MHIGPFDTTRPTKALPVTRRKNELSGYRGINGATYILLYSVVKPAYPKYWHPGQAIRCAPHKSKSCCCKEAKRWRITLNIIRVLVVDKVNYPRQKIKRKTVANPQAVPPSLRMPSVLSHRIAMLSEMVRWLSAALWPF